MSIESTNTQFKAVITNKSGLQSTAVSNGCVYFVDDTKELFFDFDSTRVEVKDILILDTDSQRTNILFSPLNKFYFVLETQKLWLYKDGTWYQLTGSVDLSDYYTKSEVNALIPSTTYMVTTNTTQNITGEKTFVGDKRIKFKQSTPTNKLGFTLYNSSNTEVGGLEYNPSSNILTLNAPKTANTLLGFRYWSGNNIIVPKPSSSGDFYIPLSFKNGSTTVTTDASGVANLSTLMPNISGKADVATTLSGYGITDAYTKTEVDSKLSAVYKFKGTVESIDSLPSSGNTVGDVYNVEDTGANYAWTESGWDKLSETIDLSGYATKTELNNKVDKVTGKGLSTEDYTSTEKQKLAGLSNYTLPTASSSILGGVKIGDNLSIDANGVLSADAQSTTIDSALSDSSENPVQNKVVKSALDGKAASTHTHTKSQITDFPTIPSKTSDLTNDSGFLTAHQDISGKANTEDLATVAFSGDYNDLDNLPTIPSAQVNSDWNATSGKAQILNKPSIPSKPSDIGAASSSHTHTSANITDLSSTISSAISGKADSATSLSGYGITDAYTKTEIDGMISAGMHYKGTKASYSALPSTGNAIGDLWNVTDTGANYAWNGTAWDKLSENIDLSGYVPTSRTVNGKALSANISLTASDVGALPSSTSIPSATSDLTNDSGFINYAMTIVDYTS